MVIIENINGDLLNAKQHYICQQCNCMTIKAHGLSKYISNKYPWADPYKIRPKKLNNSTTHPDTPGTIIEFEHPSKPNKYHKILCFMAQWCPGKPNEYTKHYSTTYNLPKLNPDFKGPKLPNTCKHTDENQQKSDMANLFIGRGSLNSTTYKYFNVWNKLNKANIGKYTSSDIVFISVDNSIKNRLPIDNNEINKALKERVIIIVGNPNSQVNNELFKLLQTANYIEFPKKSGYWFPPNYNDSYNNRKIWFKECLDILDEHNYGTIAIPYGIGCGLAGGKWDEYKHMLEECKTKVVIYKLSNT